MSYNVLFSTCFIMSFFKNLYLKYAAKLCKISIFPNAYKNIFRLFISQMSFQNHKQSDSNFSPCITPRCCIRLINFALNSKFLIPPQSGAIRYFFGT